MNLKNILLPWQRSSENIHIRRAYIERSSFEYVVYAFGNEYRYRRIGGDFKYTVSLTEAKRRADFLAIEGGWIIMDDKLSSLL